MERGDDALSVVKDFLQKLCDRKPTREEVNEMAPALDEIYWRLMCAQSIAPGLDVSRSVWDLLELMGRRPPPPDNDGPRATSSALPRPTEMTG